MDIPSFLLGLTVGLGICLWKHIQTKHQIRKILSSLAPYEPIKSLSTIALLRRTLNIFNRKYKSLQSQQETNHYLLENAPVGYLKVDEENHLTECNQTAIKLLHIERWQPHQLRFFLELVMSFELDQLIQQTRKTQQKLTLEWDFYPHNGLLDKKKSVPSNPIYLKAYTYPLSEETVVIFIENKQQEKKLNENRHRVFSDLSHELRTPLTSISLLAEALLKRTENQEKKWVEQIDKEVKRLIDLVKNWLDISQLEGNPYQNLQYQTLDLKQLIISSWQSLEALAQQKHIHFHYSGEKHIQIETDLNRLTQVFINLFDNAIKHNDDNGDIQVNVKKLISNQSKLVEINIIDSGKGFTPEDLPYVFERLYRGDKSRRRESRHGSGLGLAIVKEIIEAHNGSITAQNHPQTGSAWLQIILPQSREFGIRN